MNRKILRVLFILVVIIILSFLFSKESSELYILRSENARIENKIEELKADNEAYSKEIKELKESKQYMEKVLREELGMIKEGEKIYKFEDQ